MIKQIIFRIRLALANEYKRPHIYQKHLGVKIGKEARFTGKINFGSEPFLISIGEHVTLAHNVTFHTHDGGVWVFRKKHPNINLYGRINVGNNVFIGSNVIVLPNVEIGDNVVIGAGSVVTKSVKNDVVIAGNPAREIRPLNEYEQKLLKKAIFVDSHNMSEASKVIIQHLDQQN